MGRGRSKRKTFYRIGEVSPPAVRIVLLSRRVVSRCVYHRAPRWRLALEEEGPVCFSTACRQGSAQRSGQRGKRRRQARPAAKAAPAVREGRQLPLSAHMGAGVSPAAFWVLFRRGKSTSPRRAKPLLALKACNAPFISPGWGGRSRSPPFLNPPAGPDDPGPGRPRPVPSPA